MNKKLLFTSLILSVVLGFSFILKPGGSPGNKTGSIGDNGETCTECHGGTAAVQYSWINSNIPTEGYIPGTVYTVNLMAMHSSHNKFGFEIIAEDTAGNVAGSLGIVNGQETQFVNDGITHTSSGTSGTGNSKTWSVQWTAPPGGTGTVTFYVAFLAADGDNTSNGDSVYYSTMPVLDQLGSNITEAEKNTVQIYPNPVTNFLNIKNVERNTIYKIVDFQGKLISTGEITNSAMINVQDLKKGIYFIDLYSDNISVSKKFIKK